MNRHQPVGLDAASFTNFNYFLSLYVKAPHQIQYLESYLGRDQFDACIRDFYKNHQFQHIHPLDLQNHLKIVPKKILVFSWGLDTDHWDCKWED